MQEEQEMGNTELGVSEGVDRILSSGSMCAYKKGVILGYFDSLSINMSNLTGENSQTFSFRDGEGGQKYFSRDFQEEESS